MTRVRYMPGAAAVEVTLAVVASAAGTLVYQGFFATPGYLPALVFACLVGGVTAALGHQRTWSTVLAAVTGLVLIVFFGVFRGDGSVVLDGLRGSWNRLLTVAVPADPWGELLVMPALVMWAGAFSSVLLVLRGRNVPAPLVPPLAGFLFAVFVVGNQAGGHAIATVVFLLAALALVSIRVHRSTDGETTRVERQSPRSITALAGTGLVVAGSALFSVVGGQVVPLATGEHRFDPRDVLAPPITSIDTLTPLALLKPQLTERPVRALFTVRLDAESSGHVDRVRTAALDAFDGTTWTSTDTYRVAGSHLSTDPELAHGRQVTARIDLKDFAGPYLPVVGWPSRLTADEDARGRFGIDPSSGVVVSTGVNPHQLGYDVTGKVSIRDNGLFQAAAAPEPAPVLPAGMPEALREAAAHRFPGSTAYERLVLLEEVLRSRVSGLTSPPGHSYAAITRVLTDATDMNGYAEQYAAAITVMARAWGLPARVAVGYRLRDYQDGVFHVTTADAHAWSEVHFADYGWVTFDPSRSDTEVLPAPPAVVPRVVPPRTSPTTSAPAPAQPISPQASTQGAERGFGLSGVLHGSALLGSALAVLAGLVIGAIVAAKAHRRRRRRGQPDHAARVLGAWREQVDRLTERGLSPPVSLTFREVAEHAGGSLGDAASPIAASAELATTAVYAPDRLDDADADRAWRLVAQLRSGLHQRRWSAARLRAEVDPRPLWTSWALARRRRQAQEVLEMGRYR